MSLPAVRTTHEVIDEAIKENRFGEFLLYGLSVLFVVGGLGVVVAALVLKRELTGVVGGVATSLFYPAMRLAKKMREQNMSIRLLEIPLNNANTAEEAAAILQDFFQSTFQDERAKPTAKKTSETRPAKKKVADESKKPTDV